MGRLGTSSLQESTRQLGEAASDGLDALGESVRGARERAGGVAARWADQASGVANRGVDLLYDTRDQLRNRTQQATDASLRYVQDEPVKALLIAAAAGAIIAAGIALFARSSGGRSSMYR
jgi:ElaB/YqjD/DUF883 family membrane-anchored ribosome-binding protein